MALLVWLALPFRTWSTKVEHVWCTGARHRYIIKAVLIHITDRESVRFSLVVTELYWRKRTPVAAEEDYWPGIHVTYDHISPPIFIDISKRYCIGRDAFRTEALGRLKSYAWLAPQHE